MRAMMMLGMGVVVGMLGGCVHVAGEVVTVKGRPLSTAVFSIGRPTDIAMYGTHKVDEAGRFDFYIGPTDGTNLFLYDGAGAPAATIRQVPPEEIGGHMKLKMTPIIPDADPTQNQLE